MEDLSCHNTKSGPRPQSVEISTRSQDGEWSMCWDSFDSLEKHGVNGVDVLPLLFYTWVTPNYSSLTVVVYGLFLFPVSVSPGGVRRLSVRSLWSLRPPSSLDVLGCTSCTKGPTFLVVAKGRTLPVLLGFRYATDA